MTVITKSSDLQKKPELLDRPVIVGAMRYDMGHMVPRSRPGPHHVIIHGTRYNSVLICFVFFMTLLTLMGAIMGLIYYNENNANRPMRFRGYCTIPVEVAKAASQVQKEEPESYRVPLRWSPEPDVTVISSMDNQSAGDVLNSLLERFDIDDNVERISVVNGGQNVEFIHDFNANATVFPLLELKDRRDRVVSSIDNQSAGDVLNSLLERFDIDDNVERISVVNGGQNVEFIHDFNANATGIVDSQRCFIMDLDPEAVLSPSVFMVNIETNSAFDVQPVTRRLRALLPAAAALRQLSAVLAERCMDRPTYHLEKEEGDNIRKRSADEPKHDYLHFAGKHLLEISIDNMGELLEYEKNHA